MSNEDTTIEGCAPDVKDWASNQPYARYESTMVLYVADEYRHTSDTNLIDELNEQLNKNSENSPEGKVIVLSIGNSFLNATIGTILSNSFLGTRVDPTVPMEWDKIWTASIWPVEWRYTDLHFKLSDQATLLKDERQQQSRKAHFLMREKKRLLKGRSHAKQKQKSMARRA